MRTVAFVLALSQTAQPGGCQAPPAEDDAMPVYNQELINPDPLNTLAPAGVGMKLDSFLRIAGPPGQVSIDWTGLGNPVAAFSVSPFLIENHLSNPFKLMDVGSLAGTLSWDSFVGPKQAVSEFWSPQMTAPVPVTIPEVSTVYIHAPPPGGGSLTISSSLALHVNGDTLIDGALTLGGGISGSLGAVSATTVAASGAITGASVAATGDCSGASVTTGEADIRHADATHVFGAGAFTNVNIAVNGTASSTSAWTRAAVGDGFLTSSSLAVGVNPLWISIDLTVGDTLKSAKVNIKTNGAGSLSMAVYKSDSAGARTQLGSTQTSAAGSGNAPLSVTGLSELIAVDVSYYIELVPNSFTTPVRAYNGNYVASR